MQQKFKAKKVEVTFGQDGTSKGNTSFAIKNPAEEFIVPIQFKSDTDEFDYALLDLSHYYSDGKYKEKLPERDAIFRADFDFDKKMYEQLLKENIDFEIAGYPADLVRKHNAISMWKVSITKEMSRFEDTYFTYLDGTARGNSGSPVFYKMPHRNYHAVCIHVGHNGESNVAVSINTKGNQYSRFICFLRFNER